MKPLFALLLVLSLASVVACGGGSNPSNNSAAASWETGPQAPGTGLPFAGTSDCEAAWSAYVSSQPQGLVKEYRIRSHMSFMGHERVASEQTQREVVELSNSDRVKLVTTTTSGGYADVHDSTITRSEFVAACRQGLPPQRTDDFRIEVLERSRQTIQVTAGTFTCQYVRTRMNHSYPDHELLDPEHDRGGELISESWTTLPEHGSILVKSITSAEHLEQGQRIVNRTELELISLRRP